MTNEEFKNLKEGQIVIYRWRSMAEPGKIGPFMKYSKYRMFYSFINAPIFLEAQDVRHITDEEKIEWL